MAETFSNFSVTITKDIVSKIIHTSTNQKNYLQYLVLNFVFLKPTTEK